jgi:hypothetical protein
MVTLASRGSGSAGASRLSSGRIGWSTPSNASSPWGIEGCGFYTKLTHFLLCQTRHWTASRKRQKRVSRSFCPERTSVQHSPVGNATMRWMCVASTE